MKQNNKQKGNQVADSTTGNSMGKIVLAIVLGVCLIALAGADGFLFVELHQSAKIGAYSETKAEKQDNQQAETAEQKETGINYASMDGFRVDNANTSEDSKEKEGEDETSENGLSNADYILPDSDSKYYTTEDLDKLTKEEVKLARNEIYARHGRIFTKDMAVKEYFEGKDWYKGTVDEVDDSELNKYEIANRDLIVAYEEEKNWN